MNGASRWLDACAGLPPGKPSAAMIRPAVTALGARRFSFSRNMEWLLMLSSIDGERARRPIAGKCPRATAPMDSTPGDAGRSAIYGGGACLDAVALARATLPGRGLTAPYSVMARLAMAAACASAQSNVT